MKEAKKRGPEKKYYLSEFSYDDGEYAVTFNYENKIRLDDFEHIEEK